MKIRLIRCLTLLEVYQMLVKEIKRYWCFKRKNYKNINLHYNALKTSYVDVHKNSKHLEEF